MDEPFDRFQPTNVNFIWFNLKQNWYLDWDTLTPQIPSPIDFQIPVCTKLFHIIQKFKVKSYKNANWYLVIIAYPQIQRSTSRFCFHSMNEGKLGSGSTKNLQFSFFFSSVSQYYPFTHTANKTNAIWKYY